METVDKISFEEWITNIFDHPVANPDWSFDISDGYWDGPPADIVTYLTRIFEKCETVLSAFSDAQVAQGLNYLISNDHSEYAFALLETEVPLADRLHCIDSMAILFERYFALRCSDHLSHRIIGGAPEGLNPLNGICYMWWDILPLHGLIKNRPEHPDAAELDRAILNVIRRILKLDSTACQESALFGLFYWSGYYWETVHSTNDFIDRHPDLWERFRPDVRQGLFGR